ncbi:BBP7 family outer membrane beta-barrel protein [Gemmata sp. JC673]|uniref:BBP7 family outer membrane beta-barrel protein n=1 Tax=Gemmata algarum TaxID=2975278 RepID=A0ABU5F062_9BACT|nr:BBP7 family outer membrane beta-barrel protein [Gemmata algarum]MDY3560946.1 BBP7 family outer membrane beta-barrel protein [Gemmata algarum]
MRNRLCAAVAVLCAAIGNAPAQQPSSSAMELPATGHDPFTDPFFRPAAAQESAPAPSALADATAANDLRAIAAGDTCACEPGFPTWMSAELLIGRTRGASVAPVVTTGPASAGALAGSVGQAGTVPLFGGKRLLNDWRTGLRIEVGMWLDPERRTGAGLRLYSLFTGNSQLRTIPNGAVVINVPQSVSAGGATVQVPAFVGFPGLTTGRVSASAQTTFAGGDLNWRCAIERGDRGRIELLAGYRQLHLADELNVNFSAASLAAAAPGTQLNGADDVRTRNNFYGPQLGLHAATGGRAVWLEGHAATALGVTVSELDFARSRLLGAGGALALPVTQSSVSNRLTYLGVVAESGVRVNWRATEHVRVTAGYSFLYWNNVRRAQEMFVLGPVLRPHAIDFTTHLFSVGLDVRF